jgi:Rps23 Pro-64 3,4-dihydroxylase Tpa1-like proline 4-hydroxylase
MAITNIINFPQLEANKAALHDQFNGNKPFRWLVMENFLTSEAAQAIYDEYPKVDQTWIDTNGLHQKNKWTKAAEPGSLAAAFYEEVNSPAFRSLLEEITEIQDVLPDSDLFGAGYHQILDGGFLDVHVDFNKHEGTGLDRRMNLIVYLNPEWNDNFGGELELWDMDEKKELASIAPTFNRCVLFETNEISYHGHPKPLKTGGKTSRKSLSVYYYTEGRDDGHDVAWHNTRHVNTDGLAGNVKVLSNGVAETIRRLKTRGSLR